MGRRVTEEEGVILLGVLREADRACLSWNGDSNAVEAFKEVVATRSSIPAERRHTSEGESYNIHFVADKGRLIYMALTAKDYPRRVAFALLDEVRESFMPRHGPQAPTAREGAFNSTFGKLLKDLKKTYSDPAKRDRVLAVQAKIDEVTFTMQDSIATLLRNDEKLEHLAIATESLTQQAAMFERRTTQTRRMMYWKVIRWRVLAFLLVMLVTVVPISIYIAKNHKKGHPHS